MLYAQLAKKVLTECLDVRKGGTVTIETWNNGLPLATEIVLEARRIGANPLILLEDEDTFIRAARTIKGGSVGTMGRHEFSLLSETDAYVFIPGPSIATFTKALDVKTKSIATAYNMSWYQAAAKAKLRGARLSFGYIGEDIAALLGRKKDEIVRHLLQASLCDRTKIRKRVDRIVDSVTDGADVNVNSYGLTLELTFKGDVSIEDGVVDDEDIAEERNVAYIPAGLVAKQVDPKSVSGSISLAAPITRFGSVPDMTLEFKEGELVDWRCNKGGVVLNKLLEGIPIETRTITMLGVGLNPVLSYGYSQDRFVAGAISVTIGSFGFIGIIAHGTLSINGKKFVDRGKLI